MWICCKDSQTNFSQKGRRQQDTVTQPQIACRQWIRLCRDPHSATHGTMSVRSASSSLTVHMGNIRGCHRLRRSGLWPRQTMEPCTLVLTPASSLLMLNEDKWMIIVDYSAASWPVVIIATGTPTDLCYTVVWSTDLHLEWSEGIWQGVKSYPSLWYFNIHSLRCTLALLASTKDKASHLFCSVLLTCSGKELSCFAGRIGGSSLTGAFQQVSWKKLLPFSDICQRITWRHTKDTVTSGNS